MGAHNAKVYPTNYVEYHNSGNYLVTYELVLSEIMYKPPAK